jgi:hypothetical protein
VKWDPIYAITQTYGKMMNENDRNWSEETDEAKITCLEFKSKVRDLEIID